MCTELVGPMIPKFYAGRTVFITGATGFMGKVLIERLLSTCPDIGRIYLLLRTKKDVIPEKRLVQLKQARIFDVIKKENPSQLDKINVIEGDIAEPNLGISPESIVLLKEVSIVFHSAATLKFDEELKIAVNLNVRSVITLMEIFDKMPKVESFVYVSTAYCNAELNTIKEKIYPGHMPLQDILNIVDTVPPSVLNMIKNKLIFPKPNTYTFTKALAEEAVQEHGNKNYPIAIFRPTIVISSNKYPFPGWVENFNGPSGIIVGAGKGLLHVFSCKTEGHADLLPVDIAIDTLIAVAWETAIDKPKDVVVYNCSTSENPTTWGTFKTSMRSGFNEYPLDKALWYPSGLSCENTIFLHILEFLLHTLPLYVLHYSTRLLKIKTPVKNFIEVNQKLTAMRSVLGFFSLNEWLFEVDRVKRLRERLSPEDKEIYNIDTKNINWDEHLLNFVKGTRQYLLNEKDQDLEEAKRHYRNLGYLHMSVKTIICILLIKLLLQFQCIRVIVNGIYRFLSSMLGYY